jgi:hypothetical protein
MSGVNIQQYGSRGFDETFGAADGSHGSYEVVRNNWWANKSEILDAMTDVNGGDILTFFGHSAMHGDRATGKGSTVGIVGSGWFGDQTIRASEMRAALSADHHPPSVVVLASCESSDLLSDVRDAGVPVAIGIDDMVPDYVASAVADVVTAALVAGKTIREAIDAGNAVLAKAGQNQRNLAQVVVAAAPEVDLDLSLKDNGLREKANRSRAILCAGRVHRRLFYRHAHPHVRSRLASSAAHPREEFLLRYYGLVYRPRPRASHCDRRSVPNDSHFANCHYITDGHRRDEVDRMAHLGGDSAHGGVLLVLHGRGDGDFECTVVAGSAPHARVQRSQSGAVELSGCAPDDDEPHPRPVKRRNQRSGVSLFRVCHGGTCGAREGSWLRSVVAPRGADGDDRSMSLLMRWRACRPFFDAVTTALAMPTSSWPVQGTTARRSARALR